MRCIQDLQGEPFLGHIKIQMFIVKVTKDFYMIWKGENVYWENGVTQVFDVMDNIHQAFNNSDETMEFLFLDVKMDTEVEL